MKNDFFEGGRFRKYVVKKQKEPNKFKKWENEISFNQIGKSAQKTKNFQSMQKPLKASGGNNYQKEQIQLFVLFMVNQNNKKDQEQ